MDAGPPDAAQPDARGTDSGPPPGPDLVGRWHDCRSVLTVDADGSARYEALDRGCDATGTWVTSGDGLVFDWGVADCGSPPSSGHTFGVVRGPGVAVLVDQTDGRIRRMAADDVDRSEWQLVGTGTTMGSTTARIVGLPDTGFFSACYWATSGGCDGLISCNGNFDSWVLEAGELQATAVCQGGCSCAALILGMEDAMGVIHATFTGANCDGPLSGELTATPVPD